MIEDVGTWEMILRAGLACVFGCAIGWNREKNHKAAGIRTMMLVSLGAAGAVLAAVQLSAMTSGDGTLKLDPVRVISGVIGGVGFLGAGAIIQSGGSVHGLTTAATIWTAASIGVACGLGLYELAGVLTGFVLLTLVVVTALKGEVMPEKAESESGEGDE